MEDYVLPKRRLFSSRPGAAVINVDDPYGARLATGLERPVTFALESPAAHRAENVETSLSGSRFTVLTPDGLANLTSPLRGRFNVYNVLGAFAAARALAVSAETAAAAIATAGHVPGRFETVDEGQPFAVMGVRAHA